MGTDILTLDAIERANDGYRQPRVGEYHLATKPVAGRDLPLDGAYYLRSAYPLVEGMFSTPWRPPATLSAPLIDRGLPSITATNFNYRRNALTGTIVVWSGATAQTYYRTTDDGDSWQTVASGFTGGQFIADLRFGANGTVLIAGTQSSVRRSTDDALTWANVPTPFSPYTVNQYRAMLATDGTGNWRVASYVNNNWYLARSSNDGVSWTCAVYQLMSPGTSLNIMDQSSSIRACIVFDGSTFVYGIYGSDGNGPNQPGLIRETTLDAGGRQVEAFAGTPTGGGVAPWEYHPGVGWTAGNNYLNGVQILYANNSAISQPALVDGNLYLVKQNSSAPIVVCYRPVGATNSAPTFADGTEYASTSPYGVWAAVAGRNGLLLFGNGNSRTAVFRVDFASIRDKFMVPINSALLPSNQIGNWASDRLNTYLRAK